MSHDDMKEFIVGLRKSAEAVYLACNESVADDLSGKLRRSAELIENAYVKSGGTERINADNQNTSATERING